MCQELQFVENLEEARTTRLTEKGEERTLPAQGAKPREVEKEGAGGGPG